jgi:hypothetical protein
VATQPSRTALAENCSPIAGRATLMDELIKGVTKVPSVAAIRTILFFIFISSVIFSSFCSAFFIE